MKRRFGHWRKARQDSNLFLSLMQLATRYLRGAGRVQKACVIPSGIYVISLRMRIGNHTGQKELFLILQETISLRVSNKLIRIARKSFLVLCNQEVYPKKAVIRSKRSLSADGILITLFQSIVHKHIEVSFVGNALEVAWDDTQGPTRCCAPR
jgi:hypothetical protein